MTYDEYRALPLLARVKYMDGEFRPGGRYSKPPAKSRKRFAVSSTCGEQ